MDKITAIRKLLIDIVGAVPNLPVRAIVKSIEGETCTVKLNSGLEITDVRLKATVGDSDNYMLLTPLVGANVVMISDDGTLDNLTVIKTDAVAKIEIKQGTLEIVADGEDSKVSVKNNEAGLKGILTDLAELLRQLKVSTPAGPSGVPLPDSLAAINNFETKFNQLLK